MFIAQNLQNYNVYNIIFGEKTLNTIMENSSFCSVYFSNDIITMNNITLYFTLNNITIEPYFNKYKCKINNDNECIKQRLINLERFNEPKLQAPPSSKGTSAHGFVQMIGRST